MEHSFIVGASQGIGLAIAERELAFGADTLAIVARDTPRLKQAEQQLQLQCSANQQLFAVPCDLLQADGTDNLTSQVRHLVIDKPDYKITRLYLAIGGGPVGQFSGQSEQQFELALDLNLKGQSRALRACLPYLNDGATVVSINSVAGFQTFPGWAGYCAAKAGLRSFFNAMREELRERKIRICSAFPYATDTGYWDTIEGEWDRSKMMTAEQVAGTIVQAARQEVAVEEIRFASPHGAL